MNKKTADNGTLDSARAAWRHRGQRRPAFALPPGPGQESVWDYPRPPVIEPDQRLIEVRCGDALIASTRHALRVLETASPPTFYLPRDDVALDLLSQGSASSFCEWKGRASYFDVHGGARTAPNAAWSYQEPFPEFMSIQGHLGFYPSRVECYVDGERVRAQAGGFYGGWITGEIIGPFKGEEGTSGW